MNDFLSEFTDITEQQFNCIADSYADFSFAFDYFLASIGLNKSFCDFVRAIFHESRLKELEIFDKYLAENLDCSRETVCRLRKRLDAWQKQEGVNVVDIVLGEQFQNKDGKFRYKPTKYRITFFSILIEAIKAARETTEYKKGRKTKAIKQAIDKRLSDVEVNYSMSKRKPRRIRTVDKEHQTLRKIIKTTSEKIARIVDKKGASLEGIFADNLPERDEKLSMECQILIDIVQERFDFILWERE